MSRIYNTPEDLLSDDSFISWVAGKHETENDFWQNWVNENPEKKEMADTAIALLRKISVEETLPAEMIEAAAARLNQRIHNTNNRKPVYYFIRKYRWAAAASILFIITGAFLWNIYFSSPGIKTSFGQINENVLPDGSVVTLNANSSLSYTKGWKEGADREVWIKGEAFFHVQKTPQHSRFVVHADGFDVVVTGTKFNVVTREGKSNVLLTEGSVTIITKDGKKIFMKPGDFVQIGNDQLEKKEIKNETVLAWKDHKMIFDNQPMSEAVKIIEEQYGVDIKIADDTIAAQPISGILPNDNLDVLLKALQATGNFSVTKSGNEILITNPQ